VPQAKDVAINLEGFRGRQPQAGVRRSAPSSPLPPRWTTRIGLGTATYLVNIMQYFMGNIL